MKKQNRKKNWLNWLKFWKNWPVRFGFGFISLTGKTEPNSNQKKTESQIGKKRAKLKKPNQTKTSRFEPVSVPF
jgi:hypothetical protein